MSLLQEQRTGLDRLKHHVDSRMEYHQRRLAIIDEAAATQLQKRLVDQHQGFLALLERERLKCRAAIQEIEEIARLLVS
jgi:hypothetical protein